jgi:predicted ribosome quality control (RQC) complex YloA/Tae2 family protein
MVANYYTLRHLAIQLRRRLQRGIIHAVFSQNKNELIFCFEHSAEGDKVPSQLFLMVGCEPSNNFVYVSESFARAKKNSIDFFPQIIGRSVESISIHPFDRQVSIVVDNGLRILVQIFGSKANVLLTEQDDNIVGSFLKPRELVGTTYVQREPSEAKPDPTMFLQRLRDLGEVSVGVGIKRFFPRFGATLIREMLHRAGIDHAEQVDRLSEEEIQGLLDCGSSLISELELTCEPRIYYDGMDVAGFSIIEMHHLGQFGARRVDSLSDAIRMYLGTVHKTDLFVRERTRLFQGLQKESERLGRTRDKMVEEMSLARRADQYELMGKVLKAHLHELHKGIAEVTLDNPFDGPETTVSIPLDKNLTPVKNAERYFEKAKKSKAAVTEKKDHLAKLDRERVVLMTMLEQLETVSATEEMKSFVHTNHANLVRLGLVKPESGKKNVSEDVPFRIFRVTGEFVVWAGKSGENNDLLSTRFTKSNDLWFHARTVGGSHVVLKHASGKGEVSKRAIEEAAGIAAYYSKMKNSKLVPVSVCEGKYVRKSKGAAAGTVTIEREKVIFVEPRLPDH